MIDSWKTIFMVKEEEWDSEDISPLPLDKQVSKMSSNYCEEDWDDAIMET